MCESRQASFEFEKFIDHKLKTFNAAVERMFPKKRGNYSLG